MFVRICLFLSSPLVPSLDDFLYVLIVRNLLMVIGYPSSCRKCWISVVCGVSNAEFCVDVASDCCRKRIKTQAGNADDGIISTSMFLLLSLSRSGLLCSIFLYCGHDDSWFVFTVISLFPVCCLRMFVFSHQFFYRMDHFGYHGILPILYSVF